MASFIPRSRHVAKTLRASPAFAVALLTGCFSSYEYDDPFVVPAGERIQVASLEVEPDGTVLLLTQIGMYYSREGEPGAFQRNLHTVLYRRSGGGWSTRQFKNLQDWSGNFPSFLRDREGWHRVLVWDAGKARTYGWHGDRWRAEVTIQDPGRFLGYSPTNLVNWSCHPNVGYKDDSSLYYMTRNGGNETTIEQSTGKVSFDLDAFSMNLLAFLPGEGRSTIFGIEDYRLSTDDWSYRYICYSWQDDGKVVRKTVLDVGGNVVDAFFGPYRGGTALFLRNVDGSLLIYPVASDGLPYSSLPIYADNSRGIAGASVIAADSEGCFHGIISYRPGMIVKEMDTTQVFEKAVSDDSSFPGGIVDVSRAPLKPIIPAPPFGSFIYANTCSAGRDTVTAWEPPDDTPIQLSDVRFRLAPDGTPTLAVVISESPNPLEDFNAVIRPPHSWLILSEKKQGAWTAEVVDNR